MPSTLILPMHQGSRIIQRRVNANGDVHSNFSGFVGDDCKTEENRFRRQLFGWDSISALAQTMQQ